MQKYPIGIQDFGKIRTDGFVYIDKTQLIHQLIEAGNYYFLSRPRRFGKSLLLSTIKAIFEGQKELFKGLWIEDVRDWKETFPVIHIKFSQMPYQYVGLDEAINRDLDKIALELKVTAQGDNIKDKFNNLIKNAAINGRVVILVDEYDKPIIDYLQNIDLVNENKAVLKGFYSILKDADQHIAFLLITGVSKFSKVSVFSDLNNLNDLTLHPKYTQLVGITQGEMEAGFAGEITQMQQQNPAILEEIRKWYNGYSWDGITTLYNPFSLLRFMETGIFQNIWFESGTPTFLINAIVKKGGFNYDEVETGTHGLSDFIVENISPVALLFQTGYLTIKHYSEEDRVYTLGYPNLEVKESTMAWLMGAYSGSYPEDSMPLIAHLKKALQKNDMEAVTDTINTAFSSIPYDLWRGATELHYHALVHLMFSLLGVHISSEVHTSKGRCDALVQTAAYIYALEFKLDGTAEEALQQIIKKAYLAPFATDKRTRVAVGINFSSAAKKIAEFKAVEINMPLVTTVGS